MKQKNILLMAALSVMGAMAIASCDNEDNAIVEEPAVQNNIITVTTTVSLDGGSDAPTTRALDPTTGAKTFAVGDQVALSYQNTSKERVKAVSKALKAEDITDEGQTATLTFELENPATTNEAVLVYPASFLLTGSTLNVAGLASGQNGTLETLQKNFDASYAMTTLTVSGTETKLAAPTNPMKNPLTICKFTIKEGETDITDKITQLTITNGLPQYTYTINRTPAAGPIYVAMLPSKLDDSNIIPELGYNGGTEQGSYTFTAADGTKGYEKTVTLTSTNDYLAANTIYPINVTMTKNFDGLTTPLTFEAKEAGANVKFTLASGITGVVQYSIDGTNWSDYTSGTEITLTNAGDKVQFRGNNSQYATNNFYETDGGEYSYFSCTQSCYVYGNVMSLVSSESFATTTSLNGNYTFARLFYDTTNGKNILSATGKPLVLPATTLMRYCYSQMFRGCTSLTAAPALPATSLYYGTYYRMFMDCKSLTAAPALPATLNNSSAHCYEGMFQGCESMTAAPALSSDKVSQYCYARMFMGCKSLTKAPALPATTLIDASIGYTEQISCYYCMFEDCTSLTEAPDLPATTLSPSCYSSMFEGCTSLTKVPDLPATALAQSCYSNMFRRCTSLTAAPALNATDMVKYCYNAMFYDCTGLSEAPALPSTKLADGCYQGMFHGCTNLTSAPDLPATTLFKECYKEMFMSCTKLNSVKCLANAIESETATDCTTDWLNKVATTGTFTKASEMISWTWEEGASGIPSGWTVETAP